MSLSLLVWWQGVGLRLGDILRRAGTNVSDAQVGSVSRDGRMQEITKQRNPLIVLEVHAKVQVSSVSFSLGGHEPVVVGVVPRKDIIGRCRSHYCRLILGCCKTFAWREGDGCP